MYAPPPSMPPAKKGLNPLVIITIILLLIVAPCVIGGILVANMFRGLGKTMNETLMPTVSCAMNIEAARDALLAYAKDNGDKLPPAENWQKTIYPYYEKAIGPKISKENVDIPIIGKIEIKRFPAEGEWTCGVTFDSKDQKKFTGVAYNTDVAGKKLSDIKDLAATIAIFETKEPKLNQAMKYAALNPVEAPKIMGERREWIMAPLSGSVNFDVDKQGSRGANVKIEASVGSGDEPEAPKEPGGTK